MKHNEFVTKKHKKTCKTLNYVELLFLASTFTDWVLISVFTSIVDIIVEITRSKVGLIVYEGLFLEYLLQLITYYNYSCIYYIVESNGSC